MASLEPTFSRSCRGTLRFCALWWSLAPHFASLLASSQGPRVTVTATSIAAAVGVAPLLRHAIASHGLLGDGSVAIHRSLKAPIATSGDASPDAHHRDALLPLEDHALIASVAALLSCTPALLPLAQQQMYDEDAIARLDIVGRHSISMSNASGGEHRHSTGHGTASAGAAVAGANSSVVPGAAIAAAVCVEGAVSGGSSRASGQLADHGARVSERDVEVSLGGECPTPLLRRCLTCSLPLCGPVTACDGGSIVA